MCNTLFAQCARSPTLRPSSFSAVIPYISPITSSYFLEFITFTPTEITGLPQSGAVGESYTFKMVGDLTIGAVTKQVTFDVTTGAASESRLTGTATTTIAYADYGITIPQVRQVASVEDQVRLELEFVAVPV
jgi:hypothetical protein